MIISFDNRYKIVVNKEDIRLGHWHGIIFASFSFCGKYLPKIHTNLKDPVSDFIQIFVKNTIREKIRNRFLPII